MYRVTMTGMIGYERAAWLLAQNREALQKRFSRTFLANFERLKDASGAGKITSAVGAGESISATGADEPVSAAGAGESIPAEYLAYESQIGNGGLFGALWQACEAMQQETAHPVGCRIRIEDIPVRQEVTEILELYHENPYETPSPGSRLLIWKEDLPDTVHDQLQQTVIIGYLTRDRQRLVLLEDTQRFLTPWHRQQQDLGQNSLPNHEPEKGVF